MSAISDLQKERDALLEQNKALKKELESRLKAIGFIGEQRDRYKEALEYVINSGESYERVQEFAQSALAREKK